LRAGSGRARRLRRSPQSHRSLARLALNGVFYETKTGIPIARDVGGSVVFDAETLASAAVPASSSRDTSSVADAAGQAGAENETPKLCPDPGPDLPHGASERAQKYQEQICAWPRVTSQRRLCPSTISPGQSGRAPDLSQARALVFDACRESGGTMIEAMGPGSI